MSENRVIHEGAASLGPAVALATIGFLIFAGISVALILTPEHPEPMSYLIAGIMAVPALLMYPWLVMAAQRRRHTLTERGIICRRGIISRFEMEILYDRIQAVTKRQNIIQRMFGCGDVIVSAPGLSGPTLITSQDMNSVCVRSIPDFDEVSRIVREKMGK